MVSLSRRRPWQNLINWKRRSRPESPELPDSHQPISFARTWLQDILKANDQGKLSKIFDCKELPDADCCLCETFLTESFQILLLD